MKDREFDKLLREKLSKVEMKPPIDMWARLEGSLDAMRKAGSMPDPARERTIPLVGADQTTKESARISIRRPNKRKVAWVYIAASIAAVVMTALIITTLNTNTIVDEKSTLAEGVEITDRGDIEILVEEGYLASMQEERDAEVTVEEVATMSDRQIRELTSISRVALLATADQTESVAKADEIVSATISEEETVRQDIVQVGEAVVREDTKADILATQESVAIEDKKAQNNTSDKSERSSSAVYTAPINYRISPKRQTTPISTSIFAGNIATGTQNKSFDGSKHLALSYSDNSFEFKQIPADMSNYPSSSTSPSRIDALIVSKEKHRLPVSVGASVSIGIAKNLSIETGLTYTYLQSEWKMSDSNISYEVEQKLHYIGIPIWAKYDFLNRRLFKLYVSGGGMMERSVSGKQTNSPTLLSQKSKIPVDLPLSYSLKPRGMQFSVGAHVGVELKLTDTWGLYVEPGFSYYFENNQPTNYRTENPMSFNLRAGVRINL